MRKVRLATAATRAALAVCAVWGLVSTDCRSAQPWDAGRYAQRNILLITVDTLLADHPGAYGYERATSPAIDGIAAEDGHHRLNVSAILIDFLSDEKASISV